MSEINKFQKIGQFRQAIKTMQHLGLDEVVYCGSVKLHGTNAAIRLDCNTTATGYKLEMTCQSRNNDLGEGENKINDNCGFRHHIEEVVGIDNILEMVPPMYRGEKEVVIYGEWCGEGIMKGVAIASLPKMFVIFDVKVDNEYLSIHEVSSFKSDKYRIYNIYSFPSFFHTVQRDKALASQDFLSKITKKIEEECPVGAHFGTIGIGEGLVWKPVDVALRNVTDLVFKTKGAKHSASKVRVIAEVSPEMMERQASVAEFITYSVTENRLNQGMEYLREQILEFDRSSTGKFLSWIVNDILTEEADVIEKQSFTRKELNAKIGIKAREWYFNKIDKLL